MTIQIGDQFKRRYANYDLVTIIKIGKNNLPIISFSIENEVRNRSCINTMDLYLMQNLIKKNRWVPVQNGLDKLDNVL